MTAVPALRAPAAPGDTPGAALREHGARPRAVVVPALLVLFLVGVVSGCLVLDSIATDAQRAVYVSERGISSGVIGSVVGLCGAVILAYRRWHVVGLLLAGTGLFWAVDGLCESYAVVGLHARPILPLSGLAYWFFAEVGSFLLVALPLLLVLYPTGRLPAGRWRIVAVAAVSMALALPLALVLAPDSAIYGHELPAEVRRLLPTLAVPVPDAVAVAVVRAAQVVTMLAMPLSAAVGVRPARPREGH